MDQLFDHLAARFGPLAPPLGMQGVAVELAREQSDATGLARGSRLIPAHDGIPEPIHEAARGDDLRACGRIDHRARSLHVQCDGLLDEQVNAGGRRHFRLAGVCVRRQCDDEQIQLRFVEHATHVGPRGGAELPCERGNFLLIAPTARDEVRSIGQRCDRCGVAPGDAAAAEQADAQSTHVRKPNVSTVCSIPGSPASIRAKRAGASSKGTVCVMSGTRLRRPSCCRRTALCHNRSLLQR